MTSPLVEIRNLKTWFYTDEGVVRAVDDVSLTIPRGKTLGVVGESGCGKSVTALSVMRLVASPGKIAGGKIVMHDNISLSPGERAGVRGSSTPDSSKHAEAKSPSSASHDKSTTSDRQIILSELPEDQMRRIRGSRISMIFQEPMTSLNPVFTIGAQISEAIILHQKVDKHEARRRAIEMLHKVRIPAPEKRVDEYPHQFSGGMRQRAMIAMALACNPQLLIADEPTTALDVTIQAQILDLLRQLQAELGMSIMIITHDLGIIAEMADDVAVMYASKVVEYAPVKELFANPLHPYTVGLFQSRPEAGKPKTEKLKTITGMVPSPLHFPAGCKFHPRCPHNDKQRCTTEEPELREIKPGHFVRCHYAGQLDFSTHERVSTAS
ncbi:MAG TPA: ABC transporter ATP-binding protein [Pirellulales bacterium]|jgi:peptide/nickel transport system ATP-binding protein